MALTAFLPAPPPARGPLEALQPAVAAVAGLGFAASAQAEDVGVLGMSNTGSTRDPYGFCRASMGVLLEFWVYGFGFPGVRESSTTR